MTISSTPASGDALAATDADFWRIGLLPQSSPHLLSIGLDSRNTSDLFDRWRDAATRFERLRQRIQRPHLGIGPPRWKRIDDFDIHNHVRIVEVAPGTTARFALSIALKEVEQGFSEDQPPWRIIGIRSEDGKNATVTLFHHALSDALGLVSLFAGPAPAKPARDRDHPKASRLIREIAGELRQWGTDAAAAARARHNDDSRYPDARGRVWQRPPTALTRTRHVVLYALATDVLAEHAHRNGIGINELVTGVLTQTLAEHLSSIDRPVDSIRVAMPVSIRVAGAPLGGNQLTHAFFAVPVADTSVSWCDLAARIAAARSRAERSTDDRIVCAARLLTPELAGRVLLQHFQATDLVISSLKLPANAVPYRLFSPVASPVGNPVSCVITSYASATVIGVTIDALQIPSPTRYLDAVESELPAAIGPADEVLRSDTA
jgi:hypothetical protein